jgi:hypothetical protein
VGIATQASPERHQADLAVEKEPDERPEPDRAEAQAQWRVSRSHTWFVSLVASGAVLLLAGLAAMYFHWELATALYGGDLEQAEPATRLLFQTSPWLIGAVLIVGACILVVLAVQVRSRWFDKDLLSERQEQTARTARTLRSAADAGDDPAAFIAYWKNTQDRLDSFHHEANTQVRTAYRLSQVASVLGLVVILLLGISAAQAAETVQAVVAGVAATVAGALSAYIGRTFQSMYAHALRQTMTYFSQPVVASRLLAGERLVSRIQDAGVRDEALLEIVRSAVAVPPVPDRTDAGEAPPRPAAD